ncbi:hypothetical protein BGZ88_001079 [Linnemannia elongata]|nr:hypothetical protein BGZ88_001079 [Linnemannia elongata]
MQSLGDIVDGVTLNQEFSAGSIKTNNTLKYHAKRTKNSNVGAPDQIDANCTTTITTLRFSKHERTDQNNL